MSKPNFKEPISNIERVIEEWKDQLTENDWYIISIYQILSEPFIEKWKDMVDWHNISAWQKLSE